MRIKNLLKLVAAALLIIMSSVFFFIACEKKLPEVEDLPRQEQLPDPFTMFDRTKVESRQDWINKRRPELKRLFQHYVYGYLPEKPAMEFSIVKSDSTLFNNRAIYKEIQIDLLLPEEKKHRINLALFVPQKEKSQYPVFLFANKCGNHTVLDFKEITIIDRSWIHQGCLAYYQKRGSRQQYWAIENSVNRGYAIATFHVSDMDPDTLNWSDGIHAKYRNAPGDSLTRWGTLAAWAWGIQRVVDYLYQDDAIDNDKICVTGWSRRGKAALFAAAMDERIDLLVSHQSGTGGMALSRRNPEESVEVINTRFPHWFNGNFKKFNKNVSRLPIDQHLLVALVAPRPLMDNAGLQDTWASPHLALDALKAATPVYEFLGERGIIAEGFARDSIVNVKMGKLLQYQRDTKHTININYWNAMLDFADIQLGN
jgi:hypothetical protein